MMPTTATGPPATTATTVVKPIVDLEVFKRRDAEAGAAGKRRLVLYGAGGAFLYSFLIRFTPIYVCVLLAVAFEYAVIRACLNIGAIAMFFVNKTVGNKYEMMKDTVTVGGIKVGRVEDIQELIALYDVDGDGRLDATELEKLKNDYKTKSMPEHARRMLSRRYDLDNNGELSDSETSELLKDFKHADTLVRYVAYLRAFPIVARTAASSSAAFKDVVPRGVIRLAYGLSWVYMAGDTAYEGYVSYSYKKKRDRELAEHVGRRTAFHLVASMALPVVTIQGTVKLCRTMFPAYQMMGTIVSGCFVVPMLPFVLDDAVEKGVDSFFTRFFNQKR